MCPFTPASIYLFENLRRLIKSLMNIMKVMPLTKVYGVRITFHIPKTGVL